METGDLGMFDYRPGSQQPLLVPPNSRDILDPQLIFGAPRSPVPRIRCRTGMAHFLYDWYGSGRRIVLRPCQSGTQTLKQMYRVEGMAISELASPRASFAGPPPAAAVSCLPGSPPL